MATGKTADVNVYVGGSNFLVTLDRFLGGAVNGTVAVTNEAIVGNRDEDASVHAQGGTIAIDAMYDGTNAAALRSRGGQTANVVFIDSDGDVPMFECYPVTVLDQARNAPQVEPITTTLNMPIRGFATYGDDVASFDLNSTDGQSQAIDLTGVESVHVVVTAISGSGTFDIGSATAHGDIPRSVGIHAVSIPTAGRVSGGRISNAAGTAVGFVVYGSTQSAPTNS